MVSTFQLTRSIGLTDAPKAPRREERKMTENEIAKEVVDAAYKVHTSLGPGLLESVYEILLAHELKRRGLAVTRQVPVPIKYDSIVFDEGFRADIS